MVLKMYFPIDFKIIFTLLIYDDDDDDDDKKSELQ